MKRIVLATALIMILVMIHSCKKDKQPVFDIVDFEDLPLNSSGYWNGSDGSGGFSSGNITFKNRYNAQSNTWSGFAYTNHSDTLVTDNTNLYSSVFGSGAFGSDKYAVYFYSGITDTLIFDLPERITDITFSNTAFGYNSMKYGSPTCKKFGGLTGDDADWFKLTITLINAENQELGYVDLYLADFRNPDNTKDYISNNWTNLDLSIFGFVKAMKFKMSSSDSGPGGLNNPAYVCIDNIRGELAETSK